MLTSLYALPQTALALPLLGKWIFFAGALGFFACLQGLFNQRLLQSKQFSKAVVVEKDKQRSTFTPIAGRLFAFWTAVATVVRVSGAFDLCNPTSYRNTLLSFILAAAFYVNEVFVHKTVPFRYASPAFFIAGLSIVWMVHDYRFYAIQRCRP